MVASAGEVCDNFAMGGCNASCTGPDAGFTCVGGDLTNPSVCTETCGDGVKTGS